MKGSTISPEGGKNTTPEQSAQIKKQEDLLNQSLNTNRTIVDQGTKARYDGLIKKRKERDEKKKKFFNSSPSPTDQEPDVVLGLQTGQKKDFLGVDFGYRRRVSFDADLTSPSMPIPSNFVNKAEEGPVYVNRDFKDFSHLSGCFDAINFKHNASSDSGSKKLADDIEKRAIAYIKQAKYTNDGYKKARDNIVYHGIDKESRKMLLESNIAAIKKYIEDNRGLSKPVVEWLNQVVSDAKEGKMKALDVGRALLKAANLDVKSETKKDFFEEKIRPLIADTQPNRYAETKHQIKLAKKKLEFATHYPEQKADRDRAFQDRLNKAKSPDRASFSEALGAGIRSHVESAFPILKDIRSRDPDAVARERQARGRLIRRQSSQISTSSITDAREDDTGVAKSISKIVTGSMLLPIFRVQLALQKLATRRKIKGDVKKNELYVVEMSGKRRRASDLVSAPGFERKHQKASEYTIDNMGLLAGDPLPKEIEGVSSETVYFDSPTNLALKLVEWVRSDDVMSGGRFSQSFVVRSDSEPDTFYPLLVVYSAGAFYAFAFDEKGRLDQSLHNLVPYFFNAIGAVRDELCEEIDDLRSGYSYATEVAQIVSRDKSYQRYLACAGDYLLSNAEYIDATKTIGNYKGIRNSNPIPYTKRNDKERYKKELESITGEDFKKKHAKVEELLAQGIGIDKFLAVDLDLDVLPAKMAGMISNASVLKKHCQRYSESGVGSKMINKNGQEEICELLGKAQNGDAKTLFKRLVESYETAEQVSSKDDKPRASKKKGYVEKLKEKKQKPNRDRLLGGGVGVFSY